MVNLDHEKKVSILDEKILLRVYDVLPIEALVRYKTPVSDEQKDIILDVIRMNLSLSAEEDYELVESFDHWYGNTNSSKFESFKNSLSNASNQDKHNTIHMYLVDRNISISYLLTIYSMLDVHRIEDLLKTICENYTAEWDIYTCRYSCGCGKTIPVYTCSSDNRELQLCCPNCGRSSKTWKMVSGRVGILKHTTKRLFFNKVTTIKCYFAISEHKQYNPKSDKEL